MSVAALIKTFDQRGDLPIDVEKHVMPEFLKFGIKDEIYFWPDPKLNPGIIRGEIEHWEYPMHENDQHPRRCADITYAKQMPAEWQRLVCCKELLHILDPEETRVNKPEDINKLVEKIILPSDLQDPFSDGIHALTDRVAVTYAAAILFPFRAREILLPPYVDKKLSLQKIAELAEIPVRYAYAVMSEVWPEIHTMLIA
jgi:hypothetical protein